jgi:multiple sugar transport system ATP-binding protein
MNLYEADLALNADGGTVQFGGQTLHFGQETLAARPALRASDGGRIILGIRPEDFEDAEMVDRDTTGKQLTSEVTLIEALGSEIMVHFDIDAPTVDSGDPDAVEEKHGASNAVGRFQPRSRVQMGETATIAVATENMHFFDADTRQAIWS